MKLKHLALAVAAAFATFVQAAHARTPTETLFRPLMRGPIMTKATSAANQWAGRTTLASGSTSQVVSTSNVNSDTIFNLAIECAVPAAYIMQGIVSFANSAALSVTASTSAVYSGYAITVSLKSDTDITSAGLSHPLRVCSIVDGVSFAIATADGASIGHAAAVANWEIPRAKVGGVKVNSISSGTHFILGWMDNIARPIDATVMWEIRRSS
ncbi:MAG: hypothetical protein NUW01_19700 [Gemmatimonadaceae bacterium]|nr:hypothetical protein [Gemmatimonadaceae bacterium]